MSVMKTWHGTQRAHGVPGVIIQLFGFGSILSTTAEMIHVQHYLCMFNLLLSGFSEIVQPKLNVSLCHCLEAVGLSLKFIWVCREVE